MSRQRGSSRLAPRDVADLAARDGYLGAAWAARCVTLVAFLAATSCRHSDDAAEKPANEKPVQTAPQEAGPSTGKGDLPAEPPPASAEPPPVLREPPAVPAVPDRPHSEPPPKPTFMADLSPGSQATPQETIEALQRESRETARRLPQRFPHEAEPLVLMGNMHDRQGRSAEALKCWQTSLELDPNRDDAYLGLGQIAYEKAEFERALALWRKALEIRPTAPNLHHSIGQALLRLGRPKEAVVELERENEISPGSSANDYSLGRAYFQLKEYEKAKEHYEKAIAMQADFRNACYGLFVVCGRLGQKDEADKYRKEFKRLQREQLDELIDQTVAHDDLVEARRSTARTHTESGRVYRRHGDTAAAEQHWLRAATLDPKDTKCREYLTLLYQADFRHEQSLRVCEQLVEIDPDNPNHHANLGVANARLGRFDVAEKAFGKVCDLAPKRSLGFLALAQLYLRDKSHLPEAITLARRAVELEPTAPNYFVLGEACGRNGDRQGAVSALKRAVELDPNNATYRRIHERLLRIQ